MSRSQPTIKIATRGSSLAMAQANYIMDLCQSKMPGWVFQIEVIKTTGDKLQTASLANPDKSLPKGLFTKEIEEALLNKSADLAVHSLKDLPTELPEGLKLGAVPNREDVSDVLIYKGNQVSSADDFWDMIPEGATIASSSLRRKSQIKQKRPDIEVVEIRGNVGTRLKKLYQSDSLFGTVLAAAGLKRLGINLNTNGFIEGAEVPDSLKYARFPLLDMLPCVGQAAIGIEIRENDPLLEELCIAINDSISWFEVHAERSFLRELGGGCQSPIAALARYEEGELELSVMADINSFVFRSVRKVSLCEAEAVGTRLANEAKSQTN